jgi:predicted lysophospholipase L1 biosynthesis ABC-type transport system permease subunit
MEFTNLPRPLIDPDIGGSPRGQSEAGQTTRSQQIQRRMDARIQAAEAQKSLARAIEKTANYMLWATLLACLTTILAVATTVFEVFVGFPRPPH